MFECSRTVDTARTRIGMGMAALVLGTAAFAGGYALAGTGDDAVTTGAVVPTTFTPASERAVIDALATPPALPALAAAARKPARKATSSSPPPPPSGVVQATAPPPPVAPQAKPKQTPPPPATVLGPDPQE